MALSRKLILHHLFYLLFIVLAAPITAAQISPDIQTGKFDVEVEVSNIINVESLGNLSGVYKADDKISWHVFVPPNYDPQNPPGVFVYVSPSPSGEAAGNWYSRFERENFIYISANKAGNLVPGNRRMLNAVLAVQYVSAQYKTDASRTVISGFSGGGRISSLIVETIPGVFEAGLFMGGAFKWRGNEVRIKERLGGGAYVFMTGSLDSARGEVRGTYKQYSKAGLDHVKLISPRDIRHELPTRKDFGTALSFISKHLGADDDVD